MPTLPPFRPDLGELFSGTHSNVMMGKSGFGPDKLLATAPGAAALAAAPRGNATCILADGTFKAFVAISSEVYELTSAYAWTALTAGITVPAGEDESMEQFGSFLIGTNTSDGMDAYNMETPAGWNAVSGAPAARIVFKSNNMLVALGATSNRRVQTSAFGDHTNWLTRGAQALDVQDGEEMTGGADIGNGAAVIFQATTVRRMTWGGAGGGAVWSLVKIAEGVGAVHPRSVVPYNGKVYFLHTNGFHVTDGQSVVSIGSEKVNRWFLGRCLDLTTVYGAVDPKNRRIRFRYKSVDCTSDSVFEDLLDYYPELGEWVAGAQQTTAIFRMATPGYTLEGLDALSVGLDSLPYSLDSRFWLGGSPNLGGLDENLKFGFFDGSNAAATLETATEQGPLWVLVTSATPITDDTSATVRLGVKNRLGDNIAWGDPSAIRDSGRVPLRGGGKLRRYRINHAEGATWTNTQGVEGIEQVAGGPR